MLRENILRTLLFIVFFSIGMGAFAFSIWVDELLLGRYELKRELASVERDNEILKKLISNYEAVLTQINSDPNIDKRIATAVLGIEPDVDANTIYPKVTAERLAAARKALEEDLGDKGVEPMMPDWLGRCSEPHRRILLFLSGAFLILISFVCFGSAKQAGQEQKQSAG